MVAAGAGKDCRRRSVPWLASRRAVTSNVWSFKKLPSWGIGTDCRVVLPDALWSRQASTGARTHVQPA